VEADRVVDPLPLQHQAAMASPAQRDRDLRRRGPRRPPRRRGLEAEAERFDLLERGPRMRGPRQTVPLRPYAPTVQSIQPQRGARRGPPAPPEQERFGDFPPRLLLEGGGPGGRDGVVEEHGAPAAEDAQPRPAQLEAEVDVLDPVDIAGREAADRLERLAV